MRAAARPRIRLRKTERELMDNEARRRDALIEELRRLDELELRKATDNLHFFMRMMWAAVEPAKQFHDNWHIGAVCEHLQAVAAGQILTLVINQPPATTKSLTTSVMFPAWLWARDARKRIMCLSFDQTLATRDAVRTRNLVLSEAYQKRWPVALSDDENMKTRYSTQAGGWRISIGLAGRIVGEHPNGKIIDDPHNTKQKVLTDKDLQKPAELYDYGLSMRGATLKAWTVLLMQRLHEKDLSGHVLAKNSPDVVHLCLPMRYEPPTIVEMADGSHKLVSRMKTTPLGFQDPRTESGELLFPAEWPREEVEKKIAEDLGSWGEAGQFQQRPAPAGGLLFKRGWFVQIDRLPKDIVAWVRAWDVAGTSEEDATSQSARTAGVLMGRTKDDRFVIAHVAKGWWSPKEVNENIKSVAMTDGREAMIREEVEGGSAGKSIIASRAILLVGFDYAGISVSKRGSKVERAYPLRSYAEAGNVMVYMGDERDAVQRTMMRELLDEFETFPSGATKDQVDAAAHAFNTLTTKDVGEQSVLFTGVADEDDLDAELDALKRDMGLH